MFVTAYKNSTLTGVQLPAFEDFFDQLYRGDQINLAPPTFAPIPNTYRHTCTFLVADSAVLNPAKYNLGVMKNAIQGVAYYRTNIPQENRYTSFQIPKRTGGYRQIDAPTAPLMDYLHKVKEVFEKQLFVLSHDAAFAYVKQRSCKQALEVHQHNESRWFLKLDIKDFFPSCTEQFVMQQLLKLYPFCSLALNFASFTEELTAVIKMCLLNGVLPQGTPMSPLLTNLIMIPIDYAIQHMLWHKGGSNFKYTRYADDILISNKYDFNWNDMQNEVQTIFELEHTPFHIKREKTRYGTSAGRNWNLGLMLNKDNNITIGHQKKEQLKAAVNNYMRDFTTGILWSKIDVQVLLGNLSYVQSIEPDYVTNLIHKYEARYPVNFQTTTRTILNS